MPELREQHEGTQAGRKSPAIAALVTKPSCLLGERGRTIEVALLADHTRQIVKRVRHQDDQTALAAHAQTLFEDRRSTIQVTLTRRDLSKVDQAGSERG